MLVPPSFAVAYWPEEANANELQRFAGDRLRILCSDEKWLFADRVKSEESALAKLQLGPTPSLSEMHDMYAATIVVPTRAEIDKAVGILEHQLPVVTPVHRRQGVPEAFVYDDLHVLVSLGDSAPGLPGGLQDRLFEVQVRTGLQYAWWRATHEVIYKGGERTWRLQRVASQVRASLEMLDAVLADLRTAATLLDPTTTQEDEVFQEVAGWLDQWTEERRPKDVSRFFRGVAELAKAAGKTTAELGEVLETDVAKSLLAETEVTPFQAVLGAAVAELGDGIVDELEDGRYVLVTDELRRICPPTDTIGAARRAKL